MALNSLLPTPLTPFQLFPYALAGETVASGSAHGDNIAPCLLGGLTLCAEAPPSEGREGHKIARLPFPDDLSLILFHPHIVIETKMARSILARAVPLTSFVEQSMNLAGLILGLYENDWDWIERSLHDVVIEPQRKKLIPGFDVLKKAALNAGAAGFSISGAGPSLFAACRGNIAALKIKMVLESVILEHNLKGDLWLSKIDHKGAQVIPGDKFL